MDTSLAELSLKTGDGDSIKISPRFNPTTLKYTAEVANGVESACVDTFAEDAEASVAVDRDLGGRTVNLNVGPNEIRIRVTAADGVTEGIYSIKVTRFALNDTSLHSISLPKSFSLVPEYSARITDYFVSVPPSKTEIQLSCRVLDPLVTIAIENEAVTKKSIQLNKAETPVTIHVTAADKETQKNYTICFHKESLGCRMEPVAEPKDFPICTLCLNVPHRPTTVIPDTEIYCYDCAKLLTREGNLAPISRKTVESIDMNDKADKAISACVMKCIWSCYGCTVTCTPQHLGNHAQECTFAPKRSTWDFGSELKKRWAPNGKEEPKFTHVVKTESWEKARADETTCRKSSADDIIQDGMSLLIRGAELTNSSQALELLEAAANTFAKAVCTHPKKAIAHFHLGQALEAVHRLKETRRLRDTDTETSVDNEDLADQGSDLDKADDIEFIAIMYGVSPSDGPAVLKALDSEYKKQRDIDPNRADYVQGLHAWKSKQMASIGSDDGQENTSKGNSIELQYAWRKYCDAAAVETSITDNHYHYHAGRILMMLGRNNEALERLRAAIGVDPDNSDTRLCLALGSLRSEKYFEFDLLDLAMDELIYALNKRTALRLGLKLKELSPLVQHNCTTLLWPHELLAESFILIGEGLIKARRFTDSERVFRHGACLVPQLLFQLENKDSDLYMKHEASLVYILHGIMRTLWAQGQKESSIALAQRGPLIFESMVFKSHERLIASQTAFLRTAVRICPADADLIAKLGLHMTKTTEASTTSGLESIEICFQAIFSLERSESSITNLSKLSWWNDATVLPSHADKQSDGAKKGTSPTKSSGKASTPSPSSKTKLQNKTHLSAVGRRNVAPINQKFVVSKAPTNKNKSAVPPLKSVAKPKAGVRPQSVRSPPGRAVASIKSRNISPLPAIGSKIKSPDRGSATRLPSGVSRKVAPITSKSSSGSGTTNPKSSRVASKSTPQKSEPSPSMDDSSNLKLPSNMSMYYARFGLAQVHRRKFENAVAAQATKELDKIRETILKWFREAIKIRADAHDAYIELAEVLVENKDIDGAIAILDSFPTNNEAPSDDDSFLHAEVVRLMMKHKMYDDSRLQKHMIGYGKNAGWSALESEVNILNDLYKYSKLLRAVYAGVQHKAEDDPYLQSYFKAMNW